MLQNEYLIAKIGFDTEKNESRQVLHFLAEKFAGASRKRVAPPKTKHRSGASVIA